MERLAKIIQINASPMTAYETFRRVEDFPRFLRHVRDVRRTSDGVSTWEVRSLPGRPARWRAQVVEDVPGTRLRWASLEGKPETQGLAEFIPAEGGCVVLLVFEYRAPLGVVGSIAAGLLVDIEGRLEEDLGRLKQQIERGHIPASRTRGFLARRSKREEGFLPAPASN